MSDATSSSSTCPEIPSDGFALPLESYLHDSSFAIQPNYATTVAIERLSRWVYRWNQETDLSMVLSPNASQNEQTSYLIGLLWTSFVLLLIALLWVLAMVSCKTCWGPHQCGFFSARRLKPLPPEEPTEALEKRELMYRPSAASKHGVPFQHNGIASGYDDVGKSFLKKKKSSSHTKRLVKGTIQAPKKLVQKTIRAPKQLVKISKKQKRKFDRKFNKSKKFARINSAGEVDLGTFFTDETHVNDDGVPASSSLQGTNHQYDNSLTPSSPQHSQSTTTTTTPPQNSVSLVSTTIMTQDDERALFEYEVELAEYYKICDARHARMRRIRVTVAFCALGIVVSSILFVIMGSDSWIKKSASTTRYGIHQLQLQTQLLQSQIATLQQQQKEAIIATSKFLQQDVNGLCPNVVESFCNQSDNNNNNGKEVCDFSSLPLLEKQLETMHEYLNTTLPLVVDEQILSEWQSDLVILQDLLMKAETYYPTTMTWTFWVAVGCNMTLAVIALILCISVMCLYFGHALPKWLKTLRSFVLVPIFLLLIVTGWIFTTVFVITSMGLADACIDSPDDVMLAMLERLQDDFSQGSIVHSFLVYYVDGCPIDRAPKDVDQRIVILTKLMVPALQNLSNIVQSLGTDTLQQICVGGVGDDVGNGTKNNFDIFVSKLNAIQTQLCSLAQSLVESRQLWNCPDWYQWYQSILWQGVCYYSSIGLGWAASTQLFIIVFGMIIVTLRVSLFELNEVADEGTGNCLSNWCCCVEETNIEEEEGDDEEEEEEEDADECNITEESENYQQQERTESQIKEHEVMERNTT